MILLGDYKHDLRLSMTAVIGILNKSGVTLAADSAVTVSSPNQSKIYNTANKIFTLSKYKPIGIMIYNSSHFMSVPWKTIIKLYRDQLGGKSFNTVKEYQEDFINFLINENYFTSEKNQKYILKEFLIKHLNYLKEKGQENVDKTKNEEEQVEEVVNNIILGIKENIERLKRENDIIESFKDYNLADFKEYAKELIEESFNQIFKGIPNFPDDTIDLLTEQYYYYIRSKVFIESWTGLIFAGFGESEIFPTLTSIQVAEVFDERLRYFVDNHEIINENNTGSIVPYAQTDVIRTIIEGIHPNLDETFTKTFENILLKYNKLILNVIKKQAPDIAKNINEIDLSEITKKFQEELAKVKQYQQIQPTVQTVSILSKEDLAEMAESFIYLTYLKRRISSSEESVGGPIDVAIISKGDGFIWKKRKHYFDPSLNPHFFENYFKNF